MMTGLLALACAAMTALMCLPMAVGMLRRRFRRGPTTTAASPAAPPTSQPHPASPGRRTSAPHS
jgi:hypothetical protein